MSELKKQMNKYEFTMMMVEYRERIEKAESEGDKDLVVRLVKESHEKAKEMGWVLNGASK